MAQVIIFGNRDTAELAHYYLKNDSPHEVVAFTVHADYLDNDSFDGLPLVKFEEVERLYPPEQFKCFVPMTAGGMNLPREAVYLQAKEKGYEFASYISSHATILSDQIGENCLILEHCVVQPRAILGDNVMLWSGNHIGHHTVVKSHNFLAGHVCVSGHCVVEEHCFLGVNSSVTNGLHVPEGTFLAIQSTLTNARAPWRVYRGNPARELRLDSRKFYKG